MARTCKHTARQNAVMRGCNYDTCGCVNSGFALLGDFVGCMQCLGVSCSSCIPYMVFQRRAPPTCGAPATTETSVKQMWLCDGFTLCELLLWHLVHRLFKVRHRQHGPHLQTHVARQSVRVCVLHHRTPQLQLIRDTPAANQLHPPTAANPRYPSCKPSSKTSAAAHHEDLAKTAADTQSQHKC
jgi:hypothetical protein